MILADLKDGDVFYFDDEPQYLYQAVLDEDGFLYAASFAFEYVVRLDSFKAESQVKPVTVIYNTVEVTPDGANS